MQRASKLMAPASAALERVIARSLRQSPTGTSPLLAWPLVCGHGVALRTRPVSFADGILQVEVADMGWRNELRDLAAQYLAMINRYSVERVQRIEFVIAKTN
jgi:predicted nucleic acid-binding Zn ribbon protein